jgi:hypothetical protein
MEEETVTYRKKDIINILRDLDMIVVSLDRIGSEWTNRKSDEEYHTLSSKFLDEWDVTIKLASARKILDEAFSRELGEDDMDELEREFQDLQYWSVNNPTPNNK